METIIDGRKCRVYPYDERYMVSECGHVYSTIKNIWMKGSKSSLGYLRTNILNPRTGNKFSAVHRIVALTFYGNPPDGKPEINHIDGNKENNHVFNLEWCSRSENIRHGFDTNLYDEKRKGISENNRKLWAEGKKRKAVEMCGLKRREYLGEKHEQSKKCVNSETGEIVSCARELATKLNIPYSTMRARLNGRAKNLTPWRYL